VQPAATALWTRSHPEQKNDDDHMVPWSLMLPDGVTFSERRIYLRRIL